MTNRQNVIAALECRQGDYVPFWEMSFECWNTFSPRPLVLGREMEALSPECREKALHQNAEVFVTVAHDLGFSMVRTPSGYWDVAPGQLAVLCTKFGNSCHNSVR